MKGEFFIQVNVAFGANSGLDLSQKTFTHTVPFFLLRVSRPAYQSL